MDLDRRHLLGLVGTSALAGCLTDSEPTPSGNGSTGQGVGNEYPTSGASTAIDGAPCPDYGDRVDRVVCYDAVDPETEPIVLEPSTDAVDLGSSIEFTLENGATDRLATNFYAWRVDKYVDGEWYRVAPLGHNDPLMYVGPGDSHTWTVTPDNGGIEDGDPVPRAGGTADVSLAGVGAGTYAFRARGWLEGERDAEILAFAAAFDVEGPSLTLQPTNAIEDVELDEDDDGTEILVATSGRGDPGDERQRSGAYDLAVVDEPADGDVRSLITEQVVRQDRLRDAIALARDHDVSAVRIEEYDGARPIFGRDGGGTVEYQGTYYRIRTAELEDE